jgi:PAS domain S-box-containing protein
VRELNRKTILLVEDEALIALAEKTALEQYGYSVIAANSGEEAVSTFGNRPDIDLVLMDVDLGKGIDGTEAAGIILKDRDVPVVFLSSHTERAIVDKTERITSYGYVVKNSGDIVLQASIKMAFKLFDANSKAEKEKEHLETTLNSIGDAVIVTDADGNIARMNPVAEKLTGWNIGEAEGRRVDGIFSIVNAVTREPVCNPVKTVLESGTIVGLANHTVLVSREGREYQIADSGAPIKDYEGTVTGVVLVFRDVTEENRTQEALKESERSLREAQGMAKLGHWDLNVKTGDVEWSEEVFKIFRLDPKEFIPHIDSILSFSPWPEDHQRDKEIIGKAIESHGPGSYEQKFLRPDMSVGYYFSTFQGKYDEKGDLVSIVGTVQDITERKESEERTRNAITLLEQAFEQTPVPLALVSMPDAVFRIVNPACLRFLGFEGQPSLIGTPLLGFEPSWQDFDMQGRPGKVEDLPLARSLAGMKTEGEERRIVRKDGSVRYELVTAAPILDEDKRIIAGYLVMMDITDRKLMEIGLKESEERYRRITSAVMDYFYTVYFEGGKVAKTVHGEACVGITGYSAEDFAADPYLWYGMIAPEDRDLVAKQADDIVNEGAAAAIVHRIRRKDGELRWIANTPVPHHDSDGRLVSYDGLIQDITERRLAEIALQKSSEENTNLIDELQHRAKNSFFMILSMIGIAANSRSSPETRAALEDLGSRVASISELYSLLYSSGSFTEVRLDDYCARIAAPLIGLSGNISLRGELASVIVSAKRAAPIGLILTELITNAVKYAFPDGRGGTIAVSLERAGVGARLEVRDDGVGLPSGFDLSKDSGMGLKLIQGLSGQIDGSFIMGSDAAGTRCALEFSLEGEVSK